MRELRTSLLLLLGACGPATAPPPLVGNAAPAPAPRSPLREIDWANRTYELTINEGEGPLPYAVVDGSYQEGTAADNSYEWLGVSAPTYGDVDGDGVEEAVLEFTYNGGGDAYDDRLVVFRDGGAGPTWMGLIWGGDRGDGGIETFGVADGAVRLTRARAPDGGGACCPTETWREVWRWDGRFFVEDEALRRVAPRGP